ncbi:GL15142 [Drosophila persimilis]|uniref:GL15142 n=1 Tax=Drosophila persimilis TaxID=7234 RepID=B4H3T9_DROPE|nr:GL15142 [Drosophila persimilis]
MSEDDCSSTRDWALPSSNGKRSDAAYRKQRILPTHKGRAVLNLAAQRRGRMPSKPRAPYRRPTPLSVHLERPYKAEAEKTRPH